MPAWIYLQLYKKYITTVFAANQMLHLAEIV